MIPYIYFAVLGFFIIFSLFYVNDFNEIYDENPNYVSLAINSETSIINVTPMLIKNESQQEISNSAILKKFSEFDDMNSSSPNSENKSFNKELAKYKINDEIKEDDDLYEIQQISVCDTMEIKRNEKNSRVLKNKYLFYIFC